MMICPSCEEPLKDDAIVCTHCGHELAPIPAKSRDGATATPDYLKLGCGIVIIALFAILLWFFSEIYQGT